MRFSSTLVAGATTLMIGIPCISVVSAKIYPDDFVILTKPAAAPAFAQADPAPRFVSTAPDTSPSPPQFFPSDIPSGPLTRGQLIDAIGSRLYNTDLQGTCFGDLVSKSEADYRLLFNDVSIDQPLAISVCVMMQNGLVRGSSNMLHPNTYVTHAEAAAVFSRLSTAIRNPIGNEPWYQRYMETMRTIDRNFTFGPHDLVTGAQLRNMFCVLKQRTPQLDPMGEFNGC